MKSFFRLAISVALFSMFVAVSLFTGTRLAETRAGPVAIECLGDREASLHAVYLHGLDSFGPSWQELQNRRVLAQLAEEHGLRIALPRGPMCGSRRCWPYQTPAELGNIKSVLVQSKASCFDGAANYGVIGFSNGGFATAELFENCMLSDLSWIIISGSGGFIEASRPRNLGACGEFTMIVGDSDRYHRAIAHNYFESLKSHQVEAKLIEFEGGHRLDFGALNDALLRASEAK